MKHLTVPAGNVPTILVELANIAKLGIQCKVPNVASTACTIVATLIAGAGSYGGTEQTNLMREAERAGFAPQFWGSAIRVTFDIEQGVQS